MTSPTQAPATVAALTAIRGGGSRLDHFEQLALRHLAEIAATR